MSAQDSPSQLTNQHPFDSSMATTAPSFAAMDYPFDATNMSSMQFESDPSHAAFEGGSIMWGGMQQLSLDKALSQQRWHHDMSQDMYNPSEAANHISHYGQITPPNDDDNGPRKATLKTEDDMVNNAFMGPGQPQELPPAASTRAKRAISKRKPKDIEESPADAKKKTTRKARKGYKATTKEEEDDSDGEVKRERFLERNRVAASKCRSKKKEWTNGLEAHARDLAASNAHLNAAALSLKEEVLMLKSECLKHTDCTCSRIREYLDRSIAGMHPSGMLNMLPGPGGVQHRKLSDESTYVLHDGDSTADTSSRSGGSRHNSASTDSPISVQTIDNRSRSDRDMQALLEASIATPES